MDKLLPTLPSNANRLMVGDLDRLPSVAPGLMLRHILRQPGQGWLFALRYRSASAYRG